MDTFTFFLLGLRVFISCMGFVGNIFLILSIVQTKFSQIKSFEFFLMGLAAANLEEIVLINIYDVIIMQTSLNMATWLCDLLKFMTVFGEICSILFTVIISIFRYQKLRDVTKRIGLPIYLDSIRSAQILSGVCVTMSLLVSLPIFAINPQGSVENITSNSSSGCPPDFFHCGKNHCPSLHRVYKYLFLLMCHLLPLIIVTVTSCLIIAVLLSQRKTVMPTVSVSPSSQLNRKSKDLRLNRSTIAVVAAMALFQIDWTLYLIFQSFFNPADFPFVAEAEFFISTSYMSISPYVYGIGQNLFSLKNLKKMLYKSSL